MPPVGEEKPGERHENECLEKDEELSLVAVEEPDADRPAPRPRRAENRQNMPGGNIRADGAGQDLYQTRYVSIAAKPIFIQ